MIAIGRTTIDDLDALLPLVTAYRVFYEQEPDPSRERELLAGHLRDGTSTIYLARDERGKAIGFAQLFQTKSTVRLGPSLILEDLFVAPHARRSGVATALLERVIEHARAVGGVAMFLETATSNVTAQSVYERAGWTREAEFFKYNAPL
jgi:GNAT superfamily N-acetyltransferase